MTKPDYMLGDLTHAAFTQREYNVRHHSYSEEMLQYEYIKEGNIQAVAASIEMFNSNKVGKLSSSPLRNFQYLFVCAITLITRFAIEGGLEPETAYNASDLYIQQIDRCHSVEEIKNIHKEMVIFYTNQVAAIKKGTKLSLPVLQCMDYIYYHLHETISVPALASHVHLSPTYLSALFKKETGTSISAYVTNKRIEAAKNMLRFSEYSCLDISYYLAFSTYSYFIKIFKKHTGQTPKEYRQSYSRVGFLDTELDI